MQKLPQIHYWRERVDGHVLSVHAVRGWGDRPSNGVFLLMPAIDWQRWTTRQDAKAELDRRLKERERILFNWYGRDWRNHLCARIITNHPSGMLQVRDDFEFA